jgi:hypothetical protein
VNGVDHILASKNVDSILGKELSNIKSDAAVSGYDRSARVTQG